MRRKRLFVLLVLVAAAAVFLLVAWVVRSYARGEPPRFVLRGNADVTSSFDSISYDFLSANPCAGGKMWVDTWNRATSRFRHFLFDLSKRQVIGELEDAYPLCLNEDGAEILCWTRELKTETQRPLHPLRSVFDYVGIFPREAFPDNVRYWLVSIPRGESTFLGTAFEQQGCGNTGQDSPSRRYYRLQTTCDDHLLFDLAKKEMRRLDSYEGWQGGWWSEIELILKTKGHDLEILDAENGHTRVLTTYPELVAFLKARGLILTNPPWYNLLQAWNGKGYDSYLSDNLGNKSGKGSWLIKIDKKTESLLFLKPSLPTTRHGHINKDGSLYLYCGEAETGDRNAVYVRDLTSSKASTLIPGGKNEECYSLPNFYGDRIIYIQKNAIWIMDQDGRNQERLFPPGK